MLKNIKSLYIIKEIFSYIKKGNLKLKLIKYNKKLQKRMNINLLDYRKLSERYIIYEIKGKGKEYDSYDNNLIYEGEFLNGERNGKGKEYEGYYFNKLIFEGEYLKGKRWNGKIIGSEKNNQGFVFEGEYIIGQKNGTIKKYHNNGKLQIEGAYSKGKLNRNFKNYYINGNVRFECHY